MTRVKICGLTNARDALYAADIGADMLGFIFAPVSKRYVTPEASRLIIDEVRRNYGNKAPLCIGVFVDDGDCDAAMIMNQCRVSGVDAAQLVGVGNPAFSSSLNIPAYVCIRPTTPEQAQDGATQFERKNLPGDLPTLQFDAFHPNLYGGTGQTAPKAVARLLSQCTTRLMLSGGLTPENVAEYIREVNPWAVDVASGTEAAPGLKDHVKVRDFIQAATSV